MGGADVPAVLVNKGFDNSTREVFICIKKALTQLQSKQIFSLINTFKLLIIGYI